MSIANLFQPNSMSLYCGNLTASGIISSESYYRIDYNIGGQAITNDTVTAIFFQSSVKSNNFPAPTSSHTIYNVPVAGVYLITYAVTFIMKGIGIYNTWISTSTIPASSGQASISTFEAASLTAGPPVSNITLGSDVAQLNGSAILYLVPSNNVSIMCYQNTGNNVLTGTTDYTNFSINFLHP